MNSGTDGLNILTETVYKRTRLLCICIQPKSQINYIYLF